MAKGVNGAARKGAAAASDSVSSSPVSGTPAIGLTPGSMATYLQKVVGFGSR